MDGELEDKIKQIGSLFGIEEIPDNIGDIIGAVASSMGENNSEGQGDVDHQENHEAQPDSTEDSVPASVSKKFQNPSAAKPLDAVHDDGDIDFANLLQMVSKFKQTRDSCKNDDNIRLLRALEPFLSEKKKGKISRCVKIMTVAKFAKSQDLKLSNFL